MSKKPIFIALGMVAIMVFGIMIGTMMKSPTNHELVSKVNETPKVEKLDDGGEMDLPSTQTTPIAEITNPYQPDGGGAMKFMTISNGSKPVIAAQTDLPNLVGPNFVLPNDYDIPAVSGTFLNHDQTGIIILHARLGNDMPITWDGDQPSSDRKWEPHPDRIEGLTGDIIDVSFKTEDGGRTWTASIMKNNKPV